MATIPTEGNLRIPNFFLVGAAKAGTTSLYRYLDQHPDIYMSPVKEPCFFADEVRPEHFSAELRKGFERNQEELRKYLAGSTREKHADLMALEWGSYVELFRDAGNQSIVGEASVVYLWSATAAENIAVRVPEARILMILRDPVERAYSQYLHHLTAGASRHSFREHVREGLRCSTREIGPYHPFLEFGNYYEQVKRYQRRFSHDRLHIVLYEDFQRAPLESLGGIFRFLNVCPSVPIDVRVRYNQPLVPRFRGAGYLLKRAGIWRRARRLLPGPVARMLRPLALASCPSMAMDPKDREYLVAHYRDDIRALSGLIHRDLSRWLAT